MQSGNARERLTALVPGIIAATSFGIGDTSKIVTSYQGAVGDPTLISALQAFAGDWQVHRQDLLSSMEAVYKMATQSRKAYITTDDKLAQDLKKDTVAPGTKAAP